MIRVAPLAAKVGDVMTYVHPASRAVRHHLIAAVEVRNMERIAGWRPPKKGALLKEPRLTKAVGLAFQPKPHSHEEAIGWAPVEDVVCCWRRAPATPGPACWKEDHCVVN